MTVGTQIERPKAQISVGSWKSRRWIAAVAIVLAGIGTSMFFAMSGSEGALDVPAVGSPAVEYVDPGVEARQDALKRYHQDARPAVQDQAALKRYHQDAKG